MVLYSICEEFFIVIFFWLNQHLQRYTVKQRQQAVMDWDLSTPPSLCLVKSKSPFHTFPFQDPLGFRRWFRQQKWTSEQAEPDVLSLRSWIACSTELFNILTSFQPRKTPPLLLSFTPAITVANYVTVTVSVTVTITSNAPVTFPWTVTVSVNSQP